MTKKKPKKSKVNLSEKQNDATKLALTNSTGPGPNLIKLI